MEQPETTHFGYQKVAAEEKARKAAEEKARKVAGVFDSVAGKYDLMNDLMSLGVHRLWKRFAVRLSGARSGERVLDLAGGTGDLTSRLLPRVGSKGMVVLSDINANMLAEGRRRLVDEGAVGNVAYVQADAERLPFPERSFDCIVIAFGLRNVTYKERALATMYAALKPGGRAVAGRAGGDLGIFPSWRAGLEGRLRPVFVCGLAGAGQVGGQRRRQLPLSGRVYPHAPGSRKLVGDDGVGRFRALSVLQPDGRYRGGASRL